MITNIYLIPINKGIIKTKENCRESYPLMLDRDIHLLSGAVHDRILSIDDTIDPRPPCCWERLY